MFHRDICRFLASEEGAERGAVAAPREHAKSTVASIVVPLWRICTGSRKFIVLVSSKVGIAAQFLGSVKQELETNRMIRQDYGDLVDTSRWTQTDIKTRNGVRVIAVGEGSSVRGLLDEGNRPDLIVVDDLEDIELVQSAAHREKTSRWFFRTLMNLPGKDGDVFVVGTLLHHGGLLAELIADKRWKGGIYKAIAQPTLEHPDPLGRQTGELLWPENWNQERLDNKRGEIGSLAFEGEYQNNPVDPETQRIRLEWIEAHNYKLSDLDDVELTLAAALDPAVGKTSSGDFAAIVVVGRAKDGTLYVLDCKMHRHTPQAQISMVIAEYLRWSAWRNSDKVKLTQFQTLVVEVNGFQIVLKDILDERSKVEKVYIPTKAVKNYSDKEARIDTLSPLIENGTLRFAARGQEELIHQLIEFPKGAHDDGPDALEMAVRELRMAGPRITIL